MATGVLDNYKVFSIKNSSLLVSYMMFKYQSPSRNKGNCWGNR
jgi:hypothetical protein